MDLNLLIALDALLEEHSVTAAADRLNLSAPAMSRTLARIRRATGDDILVRTGRGMAPTPRAVELREETRELVRRATAVLSPVTELDLATMNRHFSVRGHDALLGALAPVMVAALNAAPHTRVSLLAETAEDTPELTRGQVDLEIGSTVPTRSGISSEVIGTDRMVLVVRPDHPLATAPVTVREFADTAQVTVSRRGRLRGPMDELIEAQGLERRVVASMPTSAAALDVVARTGCAVVVAERMCAPVWSRLGLVARPVPVDVAPVPVVMAWHHRFDSDPAHAWLRRTVADALRGVLTA